jgi:hypothetical protein
MDFYNLDCFDYEELHDDFHSFHNQNDIVISNNMVVQLFPVIHNKVAVLLDHDQAVILLKFKMKIFLKEFCLNILGNRFG